MQFAVRHADAAIVVSVTALGLVILAFTGIGGNQGAGFLFLQNIEQRTLDLRFALRGPRQPDPRIVIVGIDEKTVLNTVAPIRCPVALMPPWSTSLRRMAPR